MESSIAQVQHWDDWNSKHRQPESLDEPSTRRMREILVSLRQLDVHEAKLLEVGCGTGWLSFRLMEFGSVTAVDLGKEIIATAKNRYPEIDFRSGDIHTLDFPAHSFNVIVTLETFSHVPDQHAFVSRLSELLRPGGVLLLTTQNKFVFDRCADVRPAVGYLRQWVDMKTLKQLLRTEFDVRRITTLEPDGHLGFLRIVNSRRVNSVFSTILGAPLVKRLKERAGFGQTIFAIARKPLR